MSIKNHYFHLIFILIYTPTIAQANRFLSCNKPWLADQTQFQEMRNCFSRLARIDESDVNGHNPNPFMVSIVHQDLGHVCSGTLVADTWILTSSLCFVRADDSEKFYKPDLYTVKHALAEHFVLYGSQHETRPNRQTLLKISVHLNIRPVISNLFNTGFTDICEVLFIDRFRMHSMEIPALQNDICQRLEESKNLTNHLCFFIPAEGKCLEAGVSYNAIGGAIFCGHKFRGIILEHKDCGRKDKPAIYEEIKYDWIQDTIQTHLLKRLVKSDFSMTSVNVVLIYICFCILQLNQQIYNFI